ncbi:MAG: methyltransferase domain-containing protein [Gammaproteobacteria bacterium]|nr:class I SAM-dependent methyltransferase [Pseudomonadales bacterium]MCP5347465.1 class I SAM-dependent methyltransferase [Pseudomonadales bacterium]
MKIIKNVILPVFGAGLLMASLGAGAQQTSADLVADALVHGDRPEADAADDARRMPLEVLAFAGLQRGMTVFELEAGGGYYTEILSRAVGPAGEVVMHNPPSFDSFLGDSVAQRVDGRLSNVRVSRTNFNTLEAADNSMDMVTWILGPHELGYMPNGESLGDGETAFAEIARILKPGGLFLAIDHIGPAGSGVEVGGTLHRIREEVVTGYAEGAGLSVLRTSNLHKNADDPLDNSVFDSSIQGQTSKFVVLFRK